MEIDFVPFYGGVFDAVVFAYLIGLTGAGIFIWLNNRASWVKYGFHNVLTQAFSRVWLDTALVAGISGTMIGVLGITLSWNPNDYSIDNAYMGARIALITFIYGGILTGLGYALCCEEIKISYLLKPWQILFLSLVALFFIWRWMEFTVKTIEIIKLSFSFEIAKYYLISFLVVFLVGFLNRHEGTDSKITLANNANVVAALGGMAIGIFFWFVDGADLARSLDAIYLTATSLMLG
tara:strand:+ start:17 stop:724 length:708 start_codon:yes stop_codon:yes gene_type:complete